MIFFGSLPAILLATLGMGAAALSWWLAYGDNLDHEDETNKRWIGSGLVALVTSPLGLVAGGILGVLLMLAALLWAVFHIIGGIALYPAHRHYHIDKAKKHVRQEKNAAQKVAARQTPEGVEQDLVGSTITTGTERGYTITSARVVDGTLRQYRGHTLADVDLTLSNGQQGRACFDATGGAPWKWDWKSES